MTWTIARAPGRPVRRTGDDRIAVPLRVNRVGSGHSTLVEAEHLHAALCRALDGHPASPDAPECRNSVQTSPGTVHITGRA